MFFTFSLENRLRRHEPRHSSFRLSTLGERELSRSEPSNFNCFNYTLNLRDLVWTERGFRRVFGWNGSVRRDVTCGTWWPGKTKRGVPEKVPTSSDDPRPLGSGLGVVTIVGILVGSGFPHVFVSQDLQSSLRPVVGRERVPGVTFLRGWCALLLELWENLTEKEEGIE